MTQPSGQLYRCNSRGMRQLNGTPCKGKITHSYSCLWTPGGILAVGILHQFGTVNLGLKAIGMCCLLGLTLSLLAL